jgi:hypothetical protein
MNSIRQLVAISASAALALAFALAPSIARAQAAAAGSEDAAITAAGEKLFKAIADNNLDAVQALTVRKYAKHLTQEELRPLPTGPKLAIDYDGKVKVLRSSSSDAVVQATMFKPQTKDVPVAEASALNIYLVKERGVWLASAPNKKQAEDDSTMQGGWYHPGAFTFCPNKGLEYVGDHFSNKLNCRMTAVCR